LFQCCSIHTYSNQDAANDDNDDDSNGDKGKEGALQLWKHLPTVHIAKYNLDGLIPEDYPTMFAKQPSPLPPVGGDNNDDEDDDGGQLCE
jgi:hypothetical protein